MENNWKPLKVSVAIPAPRFCDSITEKNETVEIVFVGENRDSSREGITKIIFPREDVRAFCRMMETDIFTRADYDNSDDWIFVGQAGCLFDYIKQDSVWKMEEHNQTYRFMSGNDVVDVVSQVEPKIEYQAVVVEEEDKKE